MNRVPSGPKASCDAARATQRAAAKALGVSPMTVGRDLETNVTRVDDKPLGTLGFSAELEPNVTTEPFQVSPAEVTEAVIEKEHREKRKAAKDEKKQEREARQAVSESPSKTPIDLYCCDFEAAPIDA